MFKEPLKENTLFIAGGTGIAPIRSMIKTSVAINAAKSEFIISINGKNQPINIAVAEATTNVNNTTSNMRMAFGILINMSLY